MVLLDQGWDPRASTHHRVAWRLLHPGSEFREELFKFARLGYRRRDLSEAFLLEIVKFRLISVVETTIEEKHRRVTLEQNIHHLGPVRISLANRLPLLERWLKKGVLDMKLLLRCFDTTRSIKQIAGCLGVEHHPSLLEVAKEKPSKVLPVLTKVIYGCDMYSSMRDKINEKGQADPWTVESLIKAFPEK